MQELETTLTQKGQVTIPLEIRRLLGLEPHDRVRFEIEGDTVRITKAESKILQGYKSVTPRNIPEDFRVVREEFEKGVAEDVVSEG
ncbi:MAG TPA: type II toxin-antitoxin system PrlF family antitoxin [Ktedonobacteraceae bacterium]|nr:type II toxin-antitoxin system PrlF family antitoxin [Ktedonobacteraceae bacterium]